MKKTLKTPGHSPPCLQSRYIRYYSREKMRCELSFGTLRIVTVTVVVIGGIGVVGGVTVLGDS